MEKHHCRSLLEIKGRIQDVKKEMLYFIKTGDVNKIYSEIM